MGYNLFDAAVVFLEFIQHCVEGIRWDSLCHLEKLDIVGIGSPYNMKLGTGQESWPCMLQELGRQDAHSHLCKSFQHPPCQLSQLGIRFLTCSSGRDGSWQANGLIPCSTRVLQLVDTQ